MIDLYETPDGIRFKVIVQPRSSRNLISGIHGDSLKIKLTAPPVDNAANKMCRKFLAKCLKVSFSSLEILSGHTSRTKQLLLKFPDENPSESEKNDFRDRIIGLIR